MTFLHGVEIVPVQTDEGVVNEVASSIICVFGTSENAPPNQLYLTRTEPDALAMFGAGSIYDALRRVHLYVTSQTVISVPLGKPSDFPEPTDNAPAVTLSSSATTGYADSGEMNPVVRIHNPHELVLSWASSDDEVATVDAASGQPDPLSEGTAVLTATWPKTDTIEAGSISYTLTVEAVAPELAVSQAQLSVSAATCYPGIASQAVTLDNPDAQAVRWAGSDDTVATVDPVTGEVQPHSAGAMTLTAELSATATVAAAILTAEITVEAAPSNPLLAAFLAALPLIRKSRSEFGFFPKVFMAPGIIDMPGAVGPALVLSNKIRGVWLTEPPADTATPEAARAYKMTVASNRGVTCWPRPLVVDASGAIVPDWAAPSWAGMIAQMDKNATGQTFETGYWCSPSNLPLADVVGVEYKLEYIPNDPDCEVQYLNSQGVATIINELGGMRAFGNRLTAFPESTDPTTFINWTRVTDVIDESVEYFTLQYLDRPMFTDPNSIANSVIGRVRDGVNDFLRSKIGTALIYGYCTIKPEENTIATLSLGQIVFHIQITPPVPLERVSYRREVYIGGLENAFKQLIAGGA